MDESTRTAELPPAAPEQRSGISILVIDDESTFRDSCTTVLQVEGYDVTSTGRAAEAKDLMRRRRFDIVLIDLYMAQISGLELLDAALAANPEVIAIMITGNPTVESSLQALRQGAWDYLPKPFSASHLQVLIGRAAHTVLVARETRAMNQSLQSKHGHSHKVELLGTSAAFEGVVTLARKVAATDASVFISGESGTGKEQIAQFIHHHSRRSSRSMVAVNCAALPEALLESEMFGHMQGAFTGAVRDKQGLLEAASGGTLFLDEITEMPAVLQAKLLRVIQDGVVRRLGSTTTNAVVNVRFIAATNRDIRQAAADELIRTDLYYRLCVVPIHIPPLRERPEDIVPLAQHFLTRYWAQHRDGREKLPTFGRAALDELRSRPWAGNVRELQNVIEHAVVLLDPGAEIGPDDLPKMVDGVSAAPAPASTLNFESLQDVSYHGAREKVLTEFELKYLTWLVERARGNMSQAARIAGVDRTTLYRLMEKHGLHRDTIITAR
jgi:DNA-binding NtrC family response regulator